MPGGSNRAVGFRIPDRGSCLRSRPRQASDPPTRSFVLRTQDGTGRRLVHEPIAYARVESVIGDGCTVLCLCVYGTVRATERQPTSEGGSLMRFDLSALFAL